jgi:16S rRNA (uracil1498-N3)-methyltransferase
MLNDLSAEARAKAEVKYRFFVKADALSGRGVVLDEQAHQIRDVLRLKAGERIVVLDNQGWEYEVVLSSVGRSEVRGEVAQKRQAGGEPKIRITLYQSMVSREKFEQVLQKCTEVGVAAFVPVIAQRSIVRGRQETKTNKLQRWKRIIQEAAEQSHRGRIPELESPIGFEEAARRIDNSRCWLVGSPQVAGASLADCLKDSNCAGGTRLAERAKQVGLFIGPEGGFTDTEMDVLLARGAKAFSLGKRILRTETAAIVASSLILYELGEME